MATSKELQEILKSPELFFFKILVVTSLRYTNQVGNLEISNGLFYWVG